MSELDFETAQEEGCFGDELPLYADYQRRLHDPGRVALIGLWTGVLLTIPALLLLSLFGFWHACVFWPVVVPLGAGLGFLVGLVAGYK